MAGKQFDSMGDYIAAGPRRLADAWELLEMPTRDPGGSDASHRNLRAAVYLAGYAVEFALKAYIISRVAGAQTFDEAVEARKEAGEAQLDFRGRRAHSLERLLKATDLPGWMDSRDDLRIAWGVLVSAWGPDQRYHPANWTQRSTAKALVQAAEDVHNWVGARRRSL